DCKTSDLEGATEVARSENTCRLWLDLPFFGSLCALWGADTSYVFFDEFEYTDCEAFPAPLPEDKPWQEACDMSTSSREILSCAVDGWFGRTLPDSECQETVTRDDGSTYVRFLDATERPG